MWMILGEVLRTMGMWRLEGPVLCLLFGRINRIGQRIERLMMRYRAGKLRRRTPLVTAQKPERVRCIRSAGRGPALPRKFGWLVRAGGYQATGYGSPRRAQLETPEMAALLAASSQAQRILRPLCRALMIELPWVNPQREPREKKPRKPRRRTYLVAADFFPPLPRGVLSWIKEEKRRERATKRRSMVA